MDLFPEIRLHWRRKGKNLGACKFDERGKKGLQKKKLKAPDMGFVCVPVSVGCHRLQCPGYSGDVSALGFVFLVLPQSKLEGRTGPHAAFPAVHKPITSTETGRGSWRGLF